MAYCAETVTSLEYTYVMAALRATAPDSSRSRSASARSPEAIPGSFIPGTSTNFGSFAGKLKKLRYCWMSAMLILVWPTTTMLCPVPSMPLLKMMNTVCGLFGNFYPTCRPIAMRSRPMCPRRTPLTAKLKN